MSGEYVFRAMWPIVDPDVHGLDLIEEAKRDLGALLASAHAALDGPGRFRVARSVDVPGSGRTTEHVLVFDAPAHRVAARPYRIPSRAPAGSNGTATYDHDR